MKDIERKPVDHEKPRRKQPYPALSKASAQARLDSRLGEPYVPLGEQHQGSGKGKWWIGAVLLLAIAAGTGAFYFSRNSAPAAATAAAARQHSLPVTRSDIDLELTALARSMLAGGAFTNDKPADEKAAAAIASLKAASAEKNAAPKVGAVLAARKKLVRRLLAHSSEVVRAQISSGEQAIYRLQLLDDCAEDGDAVILYANGTSYGKVSLTNKGDVVLVPLPTSALSRIHVLAVEDGGGGVTFGASSSDGAVRSKVMAVGDSDDWTVVPR
jgi:hypothetical protein